MGAYRYPFYFAYQTDNTIMLNVFIISHFPSFETRWNLSYLPAKDFPNYKVHRCGADHCIISPQLWTPVNTVWVDL